jgi:cytochrome c556
MNKRIALLVFAALITASACAVADEATDEYRQYMMATAAANMNLKRVVETDLVAAGKAADAMQDSLSRIQEFWAKRGAPDGIELTKITRAAVKVVQDAAAAGDQKTAVSATEKIAPTCETCHVRHRIQLPDGTFEIKP